MASLSTDLIKDLNLPDVRTQLEGAYEAFGDLKYDVHDKLTQIYDYLDGATPETITWLAQQLGISQYEDDDEEEGETIEVSGQSANQWRMCTDTQIVAEFE